MAKIIRLAVSNLLRISAAEVMPDGSLVIVAGKNDQGKSSLLNSIALALSGKDVPTQPIHKGAAKGHVILQTEELTITRTFSQTGGGTLEVRDVEGKKVTSPQTKLDALTSRITFDPFEFTRQKPAEQLETVRKIVGLDFTALDKEFGEKFAARTEINRRASDQEASLSTIIRSPDAPSQEVSVAALTDSLEAARNLNEANAQQRNALADMNDGLDTQENVIQQAEQRVIEIERQLEEARAAVVAARGDHGRMIAARDAMKAKVDVLEDVDTAAILAHIRNADAVNAGVRANVNWNAAHQKFVALKGEADAITTRLNAIKEEKAKTLEKAKFPVAGLGFSDTGVTFNGLPFEQAGTAVKIRTSVAIARSLNPKLPVMLIRDGSLLDKDSLQLLQTEADTHGCQIWLEMVGERDDATVVIEDGTVMATPAATAKKKK